MELTNTSNVESLAHGILIYRGRISRGSQNCARANERLCSRAQTGDILARRHAPVGGEVAEEGLEVAAEAGHLGRGDEAEDVHVAVVAFVQLPRHPGDARGRDRAAGRRNGAGAAQSGQPDHDFVF